jgi:hypothetical protein
MSCSIIELQDITFMVDGKLYTTSVEFDHSMICDLVTMEDLVEVVA